MDAPLLRRLEQEPDMEESPRNPFEEAAREKQDGNVSWELLAFLKENRKWWLLPILILLGLLGVLIALSGSAAAPFIYSLF